jgi:aminoglycoside phosphotransferase (APT) family kinase protein
VPFYVMEHVAGTVIGDTLPPPLDHREDARSCLIDDLVEVMAEIHGVDTAVPAVAAFRRRGSYIERQIHRFMVLWPQNATRDIPAIDAVAARLTATLPRPMEPTVVHGDFRLGNMIVALDSPVRIVAAIDWEMGAIGDPRADLGYLLATYSSPGDPPSLVGGSAATAMSGFPSKQGLFEHYCRSTGRSMEGIDWFIAFALWKAAIFCEAIYGRYVRGELAAGDERAAVFEHAVPAMADGALETLASGVVGG